mmetsp:Transcript_102261/g.284879  ORF Transcript_102261/g.284879 Transcript_102261/m.284879 type:complete len:241 (-) Transcript_102261:769-1491(-)
MSRHSRMVRSLCRGMQQRQLQAMVRPAMMRILRPTLRPRWRTRPLCRSMLTTGIQTKWRHVREGRASRRHTRPWQPEVQRRLAGVQGVTPPPEMQRAPTHGPTRANSASPHSHQRLPVLTPMGPEAPAPRAVRCQGCLARPCRPAPGLMPLSRPRRRCRKLRHRTSSGARLLPRLRPRPWSNRLMRTGPSSSPRGRRRSRRAQTPVAAHQRRLLRPPASAPCPVGRLSCRSRPQQQHRHC